MRKFLFLILASIITFTVKAQTASANNVQLHHNVDLNGQKALKATYTLSCTNVRGHELIPILFIDRAKGVPHYSRYGEVVKQDGPVYRADKEWESTYWNDAGQFIAIYNSHLNPLPGKNEYNARILVYDKTLGHFIGDVPNVPWISFTMEGAQPANQNLPNNVLPFPAVVPSNNAAPVNNYQYRNPATKTTCPICNGTGRCSHCGGDGNRIIDLGIRGNRISECGICRGSGRCHQCHGTGKIR